MPDAIDTRTAESIDDVVTVLVTVPDEGIARTIATALVTDRLAACCSIVPGVSSVYRWEGAVETAAEILLVIKSTRERFPELCAAVERLHPYDVPEIIALPVVSGLEAYLRWIKSSVAPGGQL